MYPGGGSCPSDRSSYDTAHSSTLVASAYEELLLATAAYNSTPPALDNITIPSVRSGTAIYPVMEAARYIFTVLVGRYLGILSKDVLLNCIYRVHAYVRS